nr:GGDEF domain-containing protein [Candidatus Eremiobacteraeota bacterium]
MRLPTRKQLYHGLRIAFSLAAVSALALFGPSIWRGWDAHDVAVLIGALLLVSLLGELSVPFLALRRFGQREGDPGRMSFEIPVYAALFAGYGWVAAAAIALIACAFTRGNLRRYSFTDRLLCGGTQAFFWYVAGFGRALLDHRYLAYNGSGFAWFTVLTAGWVLAWMLAFSDPLSALRSGTQLRRIWSWHCCDWRLWSINAVQVVWGFVSLQVFLKDGAILALASLLPLPLFALSLRALHNQRVEVHRLRLARDAVQAMLGSRDPLPQINSILSSIHSEMLKETLQILAVTNPSADLWVTVAGIGAIPHEDEIALRRRAMNELIHGTESFASTSSDSHTVIAFAARDAAGRLLGVLALHRSAHSSAPLPTKQFVNAAHELAPLLRDFRTISAAQNAAMVDALTGLANRRAIFESLRETIEHVSAGSGCAVVLLDIDNFKQINDQLGHAAGDQCLRLVGLVIARNIRSFDRAGRIGGEEFVVLMPGAGREMATNIGERLRVSIEQSDFRHGNGTPVTVSAGIAVAATSDTVETLLARADRALYEANRGGRNRVVEI